MNHLTNYYRNLSEDLQKRINILKQQLNEMTSAFVPPISSNEYIIKDTKEPEKTTIVKDNGKKLQKTGKKIKL